MIIGVVGKANVGKSTFFKAATLADVTIANYPFATIKPNAGVGFIRVECADRLFNVQCNPRTGFCINHNRFVAFDMIDVAGLVPGAHEGKGMGLEFLNDLNQANALIHVIDVSGGTNEKGEPVEPGTRNPADDIRFLEEELDYWYLGLLKKTWAKVSKTPVKDISEIEKLLHKQFSGVGSTEIMIKGILQGLKLEGKKLSEWSEADMLSFSHALRKITKPMLVAANKIDVKGAYENYKKLLSEFKDMMIMPCSADAELALREASRHKMISYLPGDDNFKIEGTLNDSQKNALSFIDETVLKKLGSTGVQNILNAAVLELLKCVYIFPGGLNKLADQHGNILPDCFIMNENSTALDFAYKLHTDLGHNFIRAIDVRKRMTVGKEYRLKPGDVIEIISGK